MSRRMEGEMLVDTRQLSYLFQVMVDTRVGPELEEGVPVMVVFAQDIPCLSFKREMERKAHFDVGLHRTVGQPWVALLHGEVLFRQRHEVRIAHSCIATEQECIQRMPKRRVVG